MRREIWEFLASGRHRVIHVWCVEEKLSAQERAKLDVSLDRLRSLDFGLVSKKMLAGPLRGTKVYKLRLRCRDRELRPMLCRGPVGSPLDYTLLLGAIELEIHRLDPQDAHLRADENRVLLVNNPTWREIY